MLEPNEAVRWIGFREYDASKNGEHLSCHLVGVKICFSHWGENIESVFQNMVLMKTFGPKRDEVTGEWRRLHNEEFYDMYFSLNIARVIKSIIMRWTEHVACRGVRRAAYSALVGKSVGKRPLWRHGHRWEDKIKMHLQEFARREHGLD